MKALWCRVVLRGVPDVSSKSVPGRVSSKSFLQQGPAMSCMSIQQECQSKVSVVSQECLRVSSKSFKPSSQCVKQLRPKRVSSKGVRQECFTGLSHKVSHKSAPQEYATRMSQTSVPHYCPTRVFCKSGSLRTNMLVVQYLFLLANHW